MFHPVWIQPQEQYKAVEICVHIRLKCYLLLQYIPVFPCKEGFISIQEPLDCASELALPSKPLWTGVPLTHQRLTDARRRAISAACQYSQRFKIKWANRYGDELSNAALHFLTLSCLRSGTLHHLGLVQTDAPPLHSHQGARYSHVALLVAEAPAILAVAVGNVDVVELRPQNIIGGDDHVLLGQHVGLDEAVLLHALVNLPQKKVKRSSDLLIRKINVATLQTNNRAAELSIIL